MESSETTVPMVKDKRLVPSITLFHSQASEPDNEIS